MTSLLMLAVIFAFLNSQLVNAQETNNSAVEVASRIIGGKEVSIKDYPYMAGILYKSSGILKCSGSIINADWIVTAGHCLSGYQFYHLNVHIGSSLNSAGGFIIEVYKLVIHENPNENDIGMLRADKRIQFSSYIQPLRLPEPDEPLPPDGSIITTLGWGRPKQYTVMTSSHLKKAEVTLLNLGKCKTIYSKIKYRVEDTMFCLVGGNGHVCNGDSGGPAVYKGKLIGINSWIENCTHQHYPSVLENVALRRFWINEVIAKFSNRG